MVPAFILSPEAFNAFEDESEQIEKCKAWGLLSEKAAKTKAFYYKNSGMSLTCTIAGYIDDMTAVIRFENGALHCIHPSYLKEMQASTFGAKNAAASEDAGAGPAGAEADKPEASVLAQAADSGTPVADDDGADETPPAQAPKAKATKAAAPKEKAKKASKLELPEGKVKMKATVKEFASVPNHFTEEDDEVIIYEAVSLEEDPPVEIGTAWSSHSATLKKLELEVGDTLAFEGKIVAKKLTKHPVPYKINNPAKLQKVDT
ncbi:hypothetical protein B5M42_016660 [Paenibacillus athensensis]|uniref:Uncharacterized protein n=1 Tax=Paenibacillus athensensis TaxID=1967502 RepID=A0A4Y8PZ00_9BACL|nr:hypothetical protein [Paenibacillus athensensis]MCD1260433.1 hypothetical protein [Paenibacillus athensensis]